MIKTKDGHKLVFNSYYWVVFKGKKAEFEPLKPYELKVRHDQSRKGILIYKSKAEAEKYCKEQKRKK